MCASSLSDQAEATMSLIHSASLKVCSREQDQSEFHHLHMAWIAVADRKGISRLRMHWLVD